MNISILIGLSNNFIKIPDRRIIVLEIRGTELLDNSVRIDTFSDKHMANFLGVRDRSPKLFNNNTPLNQTLKDEPRGLQKTLMKNSLNNICTYPYELNVYEYLKI